MLKAADLVTQLRQRLIIGQSARLLLVAQSISYHDYYTIYRTTTCMYWKKMPVDHRQPALRCIPARPAERLAAADVSREGNEEVVGPLPSYRDTIHGIAASTRLSSRKMLHDD